MRGFNTKVRTLASEGVSQSKAGVAGWAGRDIDALVEHWTEALDRQYSFLHCEKGVGVSRKSAWSYCLMERFSFFSMLETLLRRRPE